MKSIQLLSLMFIALAASSPAFTQTTQPGDAIDVEIFNPDNGSNSFCVAPTELIQARVFVRPGSGTLACELSCSPPSIPGGSANIATATIDVAFDSSILDYVTGSIQNNAATSAVQGLAQEQNIGEGRIGWALAGTWSTPGDPASALLSPCEMQILTAADWLFNMQFQATTAGMSTLSLRRETDIVPFALSFADICGSEAFKSSNGGIDEIRNAVVMVSDRCDDVIFFDTFGTGDAALWSGVTGS